MHLLLFLIPLQQVVSADDLPPVSAYVGQSVTLRSGADPSWNLSSITWSIWTNTTWIATYIEQTTNVDHFHRYQGRLFLSTSTGDLEIKELKSEDAMEYTVDFLNSRQQNKVNKIKLNIKQQLREPTIQTTLSPGQDSCLLRLKCSSPDPGVTLSWQTEPHFENYSQVNDNLLAILDRTQSAIDFTCVSRKNGDNTTKTVSLKCEGPPPPVTSPDPVTPSSQNSVRVIHRDPVFMVPGMFIVCIGGIVYILFMKRTKIWKAIFEDKNRVEEENEASKGSVC